MGKTNIFDRIITNILIDFQFRKWFEPELNTCLEPDSNTKPKIIETNLKTYLKPGS